MSAGYRRLTKRTVYENPWVRFEAHDMVHPNGVTGEHGVIVTPPASAVVLLDGEDVLLTRQARYAVDATVLEIVKGGREAGEDALACAVREVREEAGVDARDRMSLGTTFEIPSLVEHAVSLFLFRDLHAAPLTPEAVERIDVVRMPLGHALAACIDGTIRDAVTAIALLRASRAIL
jgi:8-oxo-dGTP pyrophosphatase MutT (NUDIX family)